MGSIQVYTRIYKYIGRWGEYENIQEYTIYIYILLDDE